MATRGIRRSRWCAPRSCAAWWRRADGASPRLGDRRAREGRRAPGLRRRLRHGALRGGAPERRLPRALERHAPGHRSRHPPGLLRRGLGLGRDQHLRRQPAQAERIPDRRPDQGAEPEGAQLARSVCPPGRYIAGSIGPTSRLPVEYEPLGDTSDEEYVATFKEQALALAEGGVDIFAVETMMFPQEAIAAIMACKAAADLPVMATMFFQYEELHDRDRTMWGESPADVAKNLLGAGADIVGMNCGRGPDRAIVIIREMRAVTGAPLIAYPNAGLPITKGDTTTYELGPEAMVKDYPALLDAGCNIVGACCGSGPEHIRLIAEVARALSRGWRDGTGARAHRGGRAKAPHPRDRAALGLSRNGRGGHLHRRGGHRGAGARAVGPARAVARRHARQRGLGGRREPGRVRQRPPLPGGDRGGSQGHEPDQPRLRGVGHRRAGRALSALPWRAHRRRAQRVLRDEPWQEHLLPGRRRARRARGSLLHPVPPLLDARLRLPPRPRRRRRAPVG